MILEARLPDAAVQQLPGGQIGRVIGGGVREGIAAIGGDGEGAAAIRPAQREAM